MNTIETTTVETQATKTTFKPGWSYGLFLSRNGFAPSPERHEDWLERSREASKTQLDTMRELAMAGAKAKVSQKAVFNARDQRWDTSLTARVVKPNCQDQELISDALLKAQSRASKRLSDMRYAASKVGVLPVS